MAAPRSVGRIDLSVRGPRLPGEATRLARLHHGGCLKVLFPDTGAAALTAIALNTGGGLTGGDRTDLRAEACGGHLVLSTQTAERAYRAEPGSVARVSSGLRIGAGARIDWLPQETILFDRSALRRDIHVDMAVDATFLMVEPLVLGRRAMGERIREVHLRDRVRIERAGRLVFADGLRLDGDGEAWARGPGQAGGCAAMALVVLVSPGAEAALAAARALLHATPDAWGGASLLTDGVLCARLVATDSFHLRRVLIPLLAHLGGAPLPRTWTL